MSRIKEALINNNPSPLEFVHHYDVNGNPVFRSMDEWAMYEQLMNEDEELI